jgi:hypothetical protein
MQHPLPHHRLPPQLQKLCDIKSPVNFRQMVAKSMVPLGPKDLVTILYVLSFDPEDSVKETARSSLKTLPEKILLASLTQDLEPEVLDYLSQLYLKNEEILERILTHKNTKDETLLWLVPKLKERLLEIVFENQERLLRCPAIIEALYLNPHSHMSSVNRIVELAVRNGIELKGIPVFDEILKSITSAPQEQIKDEIFEEVVKYPVEEKPRIEKIKKRIPLEVQIRKMTIPEKIRLAQIGSQVHRTILLRDPNKLVIMAVIKSYSLTDQEMYYISQNRFLPEEAIRYVAKNKEWTKRYQIRLNLVNNPKCPLQFSMDFVKSLYLSDLKNIARSKNIPQALSTYAKKLLRTKR